MRACVRVVTAEGFPAMPKALEQKLQREAAEKFPGDQRRQDAYVYGTLRKTGWKPTVHRTTGGTTGGSSS